MIDKMRELTDGQMQEFVKVLEKRRVPLHSVLIAQHGKLIFEKYYAPYCRNKLQRMFSVTKSFTSLAIGLLEQEGKISLQDHICDYFPEYLPGVVHPWLAEMTIENMLKKLEKNGIIIHSGLKSAFNILYGYTSDANGIRHAGDIGGKSSTFEEAKFMLVSCCAFVNYLIAVSAN